MPRFPNALQAWKSDAFPNTLKDEIEAMDPGILPLQKGCTRGGVADDTDITATVYKGSDDPDSILVDVGIFFTEITAACSCGDEPDTINNYCRLRIRIDKASAAAEVYVVPD
jgi:hypothetical protein